MQLVQYNEISNSYMNNDLFSDQRRFVNWIEAKQILTKHAEHVPVYSLKVNVMDHSTQRKYIYISVCLMRIIG